MITSRSAQVVLRSDGDALALAAREALDRPRID
jgi:hypothetical protein